MTRWLLRIALLLILGAATTVAVAWGCAAFGKQTGPAPATSWSDVWSRQRRDAMPPLPELGITRTFHGGVAVFAFGSDVARGHDEVRMRWDGTNWVEVPDGSHSPPQTWQVTWVMAGWPWRALDGAVVTRRSHWNPGRVVDASESIAAIALPPDQFSPIGFNTFQAGRILPLRPVPSGFAADLIFYSLVWLAILFAPGAGLRTLRRRRGRCPQCGYDLRGELGGGCSECGWGREA